MDIQYVWTNDELQLQGVHYSSEEKDLCVLFVHGMSGNFIENYFGNVLGLNLSRNNLGFLYSHNRGYSHINDITTNKAVPESNGHKSMRIGLAFERFEDSLLDLDAWVEKVFSLGYKRIVLAGHSLGANKVIYYYFKQRPTNVSGIVLISPPDMVANAKENGKSKIYDSLLEEANENVRKGNPRKLLSNELWNYFTLSSQTFIDLLTDFGPADNLPLMRNPETFPELAAIDKPILSIMGEFDDVVVRTLNDDMDLLEKKATKAKSFTKTIIKGANHTYENREEDLAKEINNWISKTILKTGV